MTSSRITAAIAALSATAVLAAGCGGDDSGNKSGNSGATAEAKQGGVFTAYWTSFPDYLDPALSYTADGWTTLWPVYTSLLTFKHAEGAEGSKIVPGLAEDMPKISDDGLTYSLKLRPGLKYSNGQEVKASDFQRTIQRVLNLESGGSSFYLKIKGAEDYVKVGKPTAPIEGIKTDDAKRTIDITFNEKNGQVDDYLAIPFSALVPGTTKFENLTNTPPPGVGPYMLKDVEGSSSWKLVRNPNFTALPNVPEGKADEIDATIVKNQRRQVADVLANKVDFVFDPPTPDLIARVEKEAADRYSVEVTNSVYYFFMNVRTKPFDNIKVRQAVSFALDKRAMPRFQGGLLKPTCNFLPPGMEGFQKVDPCPYGDPNGAPNVAKAKQLIQEAGATGTPVTVWGDDEDVAKQSTEYLADTLNKIGLKAKPRIIEASTYFQTIGNQKTRAQIGFTDWFQDFPHPADFMFLVNGKSIQSTNNQNFGNTDDPEINKLIDEADVNPDLSAVADKYAEADKLLQERAYVLPYGNAERTMLTSARVNFPALLWHPVFNQDLTTLALK